MPIIKYKGQLQVEFGTGDIKVSPGLLQTDEPCGVVVFQEYGTPREIGVWEPNDKKVADPEDTPIRMTFDKTESIDVVIWSLQEAKRMMQEETAESLLENKPNAWKHSRPINDLVKEAHDTAVSKGWWDSAPSFGEVIALIHSEASEALEDYRSGYLPLEIWYQHKIDGVTDTHLTPSHKPCGIPSELADIVIRVMDACGHYGIDLEQAISEKMAYNATRPQRHGGKVL
jgi:NTP pyrophosphatase (non-canonical NTP hydrolase)